MSPNGLTMIIGGDGPVIEAGRPDLEVPTAVPARLQQVADALAAAGAAAPRSTGLFVLRSPDSTGLNARRAAVAAALQEWSGATSGTLRTAALAVLAASRTGQVRQEGTRAPHHPDEETVFEAFARGVEGPQAPQLVTGRGGWR